MEAAVIFDTQSNQNHMRVGRDVQNLLQTDRVQREHVFSLPKLSLLAGNEHILGRREDNFPNVEQSHAHAADVKRLHQQALAPIKGTEVHVPLRFDNTTYRIAAADSAVDVL